MWWRLYIYKQKAVAKEREVLKRKRHTPNWQIGHVIQQPESTEVRESVHWPFASAYTKHLQTRLRTYLPAALTFWWGHVVTTATPTAQPLLESRPQFPIPKLTGKISDLEKLASGQLCITTTSSSLTTTTTALQLPSQLPHHLDCHLNLNIPPTAPLTPLLRPWQGRVPAKVTRAERVALNEEDKVLARSRGCRVESARRWCPIMKMRGGTPCLSLLPHTIEGLHPPPSVYSLCLCSLAWPHWEQFCGMDPTCPLVCLLMLLCLWWHCIIELYIIVSVWSLGLIKPIVYLQL
jgi:hypothetical protein